MATLSRRASPAGLSGPNAIPHHVLRGSDTLSKWDTLPRVGTGDLLGHLVGGLPPGSILDQNPGEGKAEESTGTIFFCHSC